MSCGPCRIRVPITVADTDCVDLEGDGSPSSPLTAAPIIPASIPHPLLGAGTPVSNGLACEATGLEVGPYSFVFGGGGGLPIGSLPPIVADTPPGPFVGGPVGSIAWGPALSTSLPNPSPSGQFFGGLATTEHPIIRVTLEPGAGFSYGFAAGCPDPIGAPFFVLSTDGYTNTGAATISFQFRATTSVDGIILPPAPSSFDACIVSTVALFGSSGASSIVSALFGSGIEITTFGGTI